MWISCDVSLTILVYLLHYEFKVEHKLTFSVNCIFHFFIILPTVYLGLDWHESIFNQALSIYASMTTQNNLLQVQIQVLDGQTSAMRCLWVQTQQRQALLPHCSMFWHHWANDSLCGHWTRHQHLLVFVWKQKRRGAGTKNEHNADVWLTSKPVQNFFYI